MRLATDTKVLQLLGTAVTDGTRGTVQAALDVTASIIADRLGTRLSAASYIDFFSYHRPRFRGAFEPIDFRLCAGFIDPDTFVARVSTDGHPIATVGSGAALATSSYVLDAERGVVTLIDDAAVLSGFETLLFAYDAGFGVDTEEVIQDAPEWLTEAGALLARQVVQTMPANVAKSKNSMYRFAHEVMMGESSLALNAHIRSRMGLHWPRRSTVEV